MTSSPAYTPVYSLQHPSLTYPELDRTAPVPLEYLELAEQVVADCGASIGSGRLRLIVEAALEVQTIFFAIAPQEPTRPEVHGLFEDFLVRCIVGHQTEEVR